MRSSIVFLMLIILTGVAAESATRCEMALSLDANSAPNVLGLLHQQHRGSNNIFINQNDRRAQPSKGGSCGPTSVVNLLQGLRVAAGLPLLEKPYDVIFELFVNDRELLAGNTSPQLMHESLRYVTQKYLPGRKVNISTQVLEGFNYSLQGEVQWAPALRESDITPHQGTFKIIGFSIVFPNGETAGHYSVVKDLVKGKLSVIDPNFPEKIGEFIVNNTTIEWTTSQTASQSIELQLQPGTEIQDSFQPGTRFIVHTVLTIELAKAPKGAW
ncbi:MAG: hypothetical protein AAGB31_14310 [Bdellovibrio sp.]